MMALFGGFNPPSLTQFLAREALIVVFGAVVVSLVPVASRTQSFVYGFLLPLTLAIVIVLSERTPPA